ncbi:chromosome transmission fidelity protein 1, partial [Clonorchis sinensis]
MRRPGAAHSVAWKHRKREIQLGSRLSLFSPPSMDEFTADTQGDSILAGISLFSSDQIGDYKHPNPHIASPMFTQSLPIPKEFPDFPFPNPYPQQLALMQSIYDTLERSRCGIFQSPTGTGKSLSLLTASLRWILDRNSTVQPKLKDLREKLKAINALSTQSDLDWVMAYEKSRVEKLVIEPELEDLARVNDCLEKISDLKTSSSKLLSDLLNDSGVTSAPHSVATDPQEENSYEGIQVEEFLFDTANENLEPVEDDECSKPATDVEQPRILQIIYCSRTHSQLSQVLGELKKCQNLINQITVVQLAARHSLCTNKKIYRLSHPEAINEACLELGRSKQKCSMRNRSSVSKVSNCILSGVPASVIASCVRQDRYSDLFGKQAGTLRNQASNITARIGCPYYATRSALPLAQLILVPYSTLLQPATRAQSGISLKNAVIVIDEAHNLLEATTSSMSVLLHLRDIHSVLTVLRSYQQYYASRFSSVCSLRIKQLISFVQCLQNVLTARRSNVTGSLESRVVTVSGMLSEAGADNMSLHQLTDCMHQKRMVAKLAGFAKWLVDKSDRPTAVKRQIDTDLPVGMHALLTRMKRRNADQQDDDSVDAPFIHGETSSGSTSSRTPDLEGCSSSLYKFQAFLDAVIISEDDARVMITPVGPNQLDASTASSDTKGPSLYFTVLNPGRYLRDLVQQSRCVLLAGGTMEPFEELIEQVFVPAGKPPENTVVFACDHVIDPKRQLAIYPVAESPDGQMLEFTYQ